MTFLNLAVTEVRSQLIAIPKHARETIATPPRQKEYTIVQELVSIL